MSTPHSLQPRASVDAPDGDALQQGAGKRGTELVLLGVVTVVLMGLTLAVEAAQRSQIDVQSLYLPLVLGGIFLIAHVGVRWLAPYADPLLLPCAAMINGVGVVFIWRLELGEVAASDRSDFSTLTGDGLRQFIWTITAIVCFFAVLYIIRDHRVLARFSYTLGLVALVFLALPAILPSRFSEVNGAKIWILIPLGSAGLSVQPGEFAKLAVVIFFAAYLVAKRDVLSLASRRYLGMYFPRGRDLGPIVGAWAASMLILVFERDLGSALMFFGIFVAMLYIATERVSWLIIGVTLFASGATLAWLLVDRVRLRVDVWLDPYSDINGDGFQIAQSQFGLGTGGLFGTGPGAGNPELMGLFAKSDFIVTTIGEEIGLFGLTAVLCLYMIIAGRGVRAALHVRDSFGKLLAGGLAFGLAWQVFVIVGGVTKLIPLTGITTPFLAYGGSSLVANWILLALLLRVSDAGRKPPREKPRVLQLKDAPTEVMKL